MFHVCQAMPQFIDLFKPTTARALTLKKLISLLKPDFSETGANKRRYENEVYSAFCKYLREAASKLIHIYTQSIYLCFHLLLLAK